MPGCPNGSTVAPGAPTSFYLGPALVETLMPDWAAWLGQLIPLIGMELVMTADLCASDPPDQPAISLADVATAMVTPLGMAGLANKVVQVARAQAWNTYCVCNASTSDVWTVVASSDACIAGASEQLGPFLVPSGSHHFKVFMSIYDGGADDGWGGGAGYLGGTFVTDSGGHHVYRADGLVEIFDVTATVDRWWLTHSAADGGANACTHLEVQMLTPAGTVIVPSVPAPQDRPAGLPDSPTVSACSSIADVCSLLQYMAIMQSSNSTSQGDIQNQVSNLSAALPPTTLAPLDTYTGQTGNVSKAVSGIRGVAVTFTTIPSFKGWQWDAPKSYADLGVIRFGNGSGYGEDIPLIHNPHIILDPPTSATTVNMSLAPGVVATLTTFAKES